MNLPEKEDGIYLLLKETFLDWRWCCPSLVTISIRLQTRRTSSQQFDI